MRGAGAEDGAGETDGGGVICPQSRSRWDLNRHAQEVPAAASRSSDPKVYGRVGSLSECDSIAGLEKPRYGRSPEDGPHQRHLVEAATRVAALRMVERLPRVDRVAAGRGNGQCHNGAGAGHPERRRRHGPCVYFGHQHRPGADVRGGSRAASPNRAPAPTASFLPARKPRCAAAGCTGGLMGVATTATAWADAGRCPPRWSQQQETSRRGGQAVAPRRAAAAHLPGSVGGGTIPGRGASGSGGGPGGEWRRKEERRGWGREHGGQAEGKGVAPNRRR